MIDFTEDFYRVFILCRIITWTIKVNKEMVKHPMNERENELKCILE